MEAAARAIGGESSGGCRWELSGGRGGELRWQWLPGGKERTATAMVVAGGGLIRGGLTARLCGSERVDGIGRERQ